MFISRVFCALFWWCSKFPSPWLISGFYLIKPFPIVPQNKLHQMLALLKDDAASLCTSLLFWSLINGLMYGFGAKAYGNHHLFLHVNVGNDSVHWCSSIRAASWWPSTLTYIAILVTATGRYIACMCVCASGTLIYFLEHAYWIYKYTCNPQCCKIRAGLLND